ncbi:putative non-specific serine/threonine protein kinase [Helianthus anomalus]
MMPGTVSDELGKLTSIERLFLNSNFFTGELPALFANLINMKDFRIGGNNFSGKIPEFIGEWTHLTSLRIMASGLEGPIPPNITLLTNLTDLLVIPHICYIMCLPFRLSICVDFVKRCRRISD